MGIIKENRKNKNSKKKESVFKTQAISQANERQSKTNVALPDDLNVIENKKWVDSNEK